MATFFQICYNSVVNNHAIIPYTSELWERPYIIVNHKQISKYLKIIFANNKQGWRRSSGMFLGTGGQLVADVLGHLQGSSSTAWPSKMGGTGCLIMSISSCHATPHHTTYLPRRKKASIKRRWKSEISHNKQVFPGMRKHSTQCHCRFIHSHIDGCTLSSGTEILSGILCSYWYSKTLRISLLQASIRGGNANLKSKVAIFVVRGAVSRGICYWDRFQ